MAIIVRIEERTDGFTDSFSGIIEKTETKIHQYEDFRGGHPCDYDFGAQKQYNDLCGGLSTAMSMWMNRPTYVHKRLSIADIKIHPVQRSHVTIKSRVFENLDYYKEESCNVDLEKKVYNSVESSWSNVQPFFNGEIIDYELETLDSSSFYYSQRWGESTERQESRVLKSPSAAYPIVFVKPRKSINVELKAIKTTISVRIKYRCDYDGDTSYSYETIRVKLYTDPDIDII